MSTVKSLTEQEALQYALDSLHRHSIIDTYTILQSNFPDFEPSFLFRTLILQQCWVDICTDKLNDAIIHIQELGESPVQVFYQMWRQTTRNQARQTLYEYLHKQSLLSQADEENYSILLKLIQIKNQDISLPKRQKSFFSFSQKHKIENQTKTEYISQCQDDIIKAFCNTLKNLTENETNNKFESGSPINETYNENKTMIFPDLFNQLIPKESTSNSFIGNIFLIETLPPKILKYLKTNEGSTVERLWILHCQHKIPEMQQMFIQDISQFKSEKFESKPKKLFQFQRQPSNYIQNIPIHPVKKHKKPKSLKFCDLYYTQMNEYEKESLFNILAVNGYFCECELNDITKLLYRICKNKLLFDQNWWNKTTSLNFDSFFKDFAKFCSINNLYLPFEMFIINNPKTKEIDLTNDTSMDEHPLIRFIWNVWVKRDTYSASISNFQLISKMEKNETNLEELWKDLPEDSLAPLSLFVWNKDTRRFLPNSPESTLLSERLKKKFPLLSDLVRGETPHPQTNETYKIPPNDKNWRFLLYTSKYDLELHDLIESHFTQYDFSKIFTKYYGEEKFPFQPSFPHFDHPELVSSPSSPPYLYYVKSLLPVSAFQTAVSDNITEDQFKELCLNCIKEALTNKSIRLAALTFIELTDFKFKTDISVDFKLSISIFDRLSKKKESSGFIFSSFLSADTNSHLEGESSNNNLSHDEVIIKNILNVCESKSQESASFLQQKLHPTNIDVLLLSLLLGIRCNLPPNYDIINLIASKMHPAELILFLDRAEEIGCKYDMNEIAKIVHQKMPMNSLKEPILFILTQELPLTFNSNNTKNGREEEEERIEMEMEPALVVFKALNKKDEAPYVSLLKEALKRRDSFYSIIASMTENADQSICALITLVTMTDAFSLDVCDPPVKEERSRLFLEVCSRLLFDGKSDDVLKTIELFGKESIILPIVNFYNSVFIFAFKRAQLSISRFYEQIKNCGKNDNKVIKDDLLEEIDVEDIMNTMFPLQEELAKHCALKSQVHLFRYLQLLNETIGSEPNLISPFLRQRVKLAQIIEGHDNFRKSLMQCNLIGDKKQIISDLITHHSLNLGRQAAECFGFSSSEVVTKWMESQYLSASTPDEVIKVHSRVAESIKHPTAINESSNDSENINDYYDYSDEEDENDEDNQNILTFANPLFFVSLFAQLLQYEKPSSVIHILKFAEKLIKLKKEKEEQNSEGKESFLKYIKSLILYINICTEHSIDSKVLIQSKSKKETLTKESNAAILQILFPPKENQQKFNDFVKSIPTDVILNFASKPVVYSVESISNFFMFSIDKTIEFCLSERGLNEARILSEWQNRKPKLIAALDIVNLLFNVFNMNHSKVVHIIDDENEEQESPQFFSSDQKDFIVENGIDSSNFKEKSIDCFFLDSIEAKELQTVLESLESKQSSIFKKISLHFQASAALLSYSESDTEYKSKASHLIRPSLYLGKAATQRTIEFLQSLLPLMVSQLSLTRNLIESENLSDDDVSDYLSSIFIKTLVNLSQKPKSEISFVIINDYGEKFINFANLCHDSTLLGDKLLSYAKRQIKNEAKENDEKIVSNEKRITILSNILLHASLCTTKIEECSELLNLLYEKVFSEKEKIEKNSEIYQNMMKIITKFQEPSLLPRFIQFIIEKNEDDIDSIQIDEISPKLGLEILNEARQMKGFYPDNFFNITLACKLYQEHAVLQIECANNLLDRIIDNKPEKEKEAENENEADINNESFSETSSSNMSESGSGADLIPLDKREQRRQKKLEKQKQKEEKKEERKMKPIFKKKDKTNKKIDKQEILQESSRHFLLALAYSLHEKCYHMSMECLKKLTLISLQRELSNTNTNTNSNLLSSSSSNLLMNMNDKNLNVFGLNEEEVLNLMMTREFPFALTIAISYDMDNELNWSKCLFAQSIQKQGDDFLAAFVYFKPITSNLWKGVVERYRQFFESRDRSTASQDKEIKERMKMFLLKIPNLVERYRLLKKLNFENLVESMREKYPVICEWCDKVI